MTFVESDPKAPFSIVTTPRCRRGCYSFSEIAPLYPWYPPYNSDCIARWPHVPFLGTLVWHDRGLNRLQLSPFLLETSGSPSPIAWATSGLLPSVQNYKPYIVFSSPMRKYGHPLTLTYFLFMAGYRNLHTSVIFLVICWSYLQTEISIILSIGNKSYSRHYTLYFSFL